jgi:hypothetical protein
LPRRPGTHVPRCAGRHAGAGPRCRPRDRALQRRVDPVRGQGRPAPASQPQSGRVRVRVPPALPQIPIKRPCRLHPEGNGPMPRLAAAARRADDVDDPVPQIDGGDLEAGQLRQPQPAPAVQEEHDDRRFPPRGEVGPSAGCEQRAQGVSGSPGGGHPDSRRSVPVPHPHAVASGRGGAPRRTILAPCCWTGSPGPQPASPAHGRGPARPGRPQVMLGQPAGQTPQRVPVRLDGVVRVAVGPQGQFPGHRQDGKDRMSHADCYRHMERSLQPLAAATGISALVRRSASWAALVTAWSR